MGFRFAIALGGAGLALWTAPVNAGPCSEDLYQADVAIGKRLDAIAAEGKTGVESTFATKHRQPTPATVAGAEAQLGDISDSQLQAVRDFMRQAKEADDRGDKASCENALAGAKKILGM
jgi:hypothetical protein